MYLDTSESAPALVPEDVTTKLGLPEDLQAERIFIHKTANYENYIVVQGDRVVAYTPGIEDEEPLTVLELTDGEKISDISAIGNTLIFSSTKDLHYVLYKEKQYIPQGNKIPFPYINFDLVEKQGAAVQGYFEPDLQNVVSDPDLEYLESQWNTNKDGKGQHLNDRVSEQLAYLWSQYDSYYQRAAENRDNFSSPIFIRYALEMFDGSLLSSVPILLNPSETDLIAYANYREGEREGQHEEPEFFYESRLQLNVTEYKVKATLTNGDEYDSWKDFYSSLKIYITRPFIHYINRNASSISNIRRETPTGDVSYEVSAEVHATVLTEEALLEQSANAYEVRTIELFDNKGNLTNDFKDLSDGIEFGPSIVPESGYEEQNLLIKDDMKHYAQTSPQINTYNNKLLLIQTSQLIDYDYNRLNSYNVVTPKGTNQKISNITYDVTYLLRTYVEEKIIKKQFSYNYLPTEEEKIYAFQIFPDSRAYKMIVKATITSTDGQAIQYGEFDMYPHPYLDCAYYYGGTSIELVNLCNLTSSENYSADYIDNLDNKLLVSEMNNPRFFPTENRYTFQSKVLGIAIANTALSQGQFGQFPLYVFTEDGIWVMETAADGSFVSQKPLSREVCCNPESITSIDNAVVFVANKGVMMLQGSTVVNISPFMNGRHYVVEESAKLLIKAQEGFSDIVDTLSDKTPFMAFMKKAKVAYDYAGQRLIFIAEDEVFQYVYKIDTQTWHKVAFNHLNLLQPINAYPECLVQGVDEGKTRIYNMSTILDTDDYQETAKGVIITRQLDLGEPDVLKTITDVRVRGQYRRGAVKFILLGSNDGIHFCTISTLRGKSWKLFRMIILADLEPTERISWVDVQYETRFTNKLR